MAIAVAMAGLPPMAMASTKDELEAARGSLAEAAAQVDAAQAEVDRLTGEVGRLSGEVTVAQGRYADVSRGLSSLLRASYKAGGAPSALSVALSSESAESLVERMRYADEASAALAKATDGLRRAKAELEAQYAEVSAAKDAQEAAMASLGERLAEAQGEADALEERLAEEQAEAERVAAASRQAAPYAGGADDGDGGDGGSPAPTFATGDTSGWRTGIASAYGGWSDPSTGAVSSTATGDICDDWSMGVAVPMAWPDYRSYFGRQVEISYDGQSVIATVNDCGYMGGGSRSLDLQPGVFKAFGYYDCDSWGLRTVSYRFL